MYFVVTPKEEEEEEAVQFDSKRLALSCLQKFVAVLTLGNFRSPETYYTSNDITLLLVLVLLLADKYY